MSHLTVRLAQGNASENRKVLPLDERRALVKIRQEARQNKATLHSAGAGGLPPSLVLGVFRRDKWTCKRCSKSEDLTIHHKAGLENPTSAWLKAKGHSNDPNNLVTICNPCHDAIHNEDRARGEKNADHGKKERE